MRNQIGICAKVFGHGRSLPRILVGRGLVAWACLCLGSTRDAGAQAEELLAAPLPFVASEPAMPLIPASNRAVPDGSPSPSGKHGANESKVTLSLSANTSLAELPSFPQLGDARGAATPLGNFHLVSDASSLPSMPSLPQSFSPPLAPRDAAPLSLPAPPMSTPPALLEMPLSSPAAVAESDAAESSPPADAVPFSPWDHEDHPTRLPLAPLEQNAAENHPGPDRDVAEQTTPSKAPWEPVPTQPVPSGSFRSEPLPTASIPTQPLPSEPVPFEPVPFEPVPFEPVPSEPVPFEPVPSKAAPPAVDALLPESLQTARADTSDAWEVLPSALSADISLQGPLPPDEAASRLDSHGDALAQYDRFGVAWGVNWATPGTYHQPLYFEDVNLERYGHSAGIFQPAMSAVHFFGRIPALPYLLVAHPIGEHVYTLGHFRPGSCAPHLWRRPRHKVAATLAQMSVVTGLFFLIP